jgi:hypothetical protein
VESKKSFCAIMCPSQTEQSIFSSRYVRILGLRNLFGEVIMLRVA